ncbi:hypothetical protein FO519_005271 [Halicephalobus sp. NKZ332]|nr:hypothetical protein FO519_005271 [Halicephalobus sp. NKZ332]
MNFDSVITTFKKKPPERRKVTPEELALAKHQLWLTLVSSPRPQTVEGIENHFEVDNGYSLEHFVKALGFHTVDGFLASEHCSKFIIREVIKDELDEFGKIRYSATSVDDITHITNCISETRLLEDERESRKEFFRNAKYSTEEFQEKALVLREQIIRAAFESMQETSSDSVTWQVIQTKYLATYGIVLTKKHLRTGFPTGHPIRVLEKYMEEEFTTEIPDGLTGNIIVRLKKPLEEILEIYREAREKREQLGNRIKMPEFRTSNNVYVDYVRERQKKEVVREEKKIPKIRIW